MTGRIATRRGRAGELREHADAIDRFCRRWGDPAARPWLAAAVGDYEAAHAAARSTGREDLVAATGRRAGHCRLRRVGFIKDDIRQWGLTGEALLALEDLGDLGACPDGH